MNAGWLLLDGAPMVGLGVTAAPVSRVLFNRDGYCGADSNAIARAAGYAPATFYKHFVDKRAILLALVAADPVARDYYVAQRSRRLDLLRALRDERRRRADDRERDDMRLYPSERLCDALATGEAAVVGLAVARREALRTEMLRGRSRG